MVQDVFLIGGVMVAVALVPVIILTVMFRLIDYVADDEAIRDVQQANGDGGSPELSNEATAPTGTGQIQGDPFAAEKSTTPDPDIDPEEWTPASESTTTCPECNADNDAEFDRCWNCLESL